jgi:hypothetical protein
VSRAHERRRDSLAPAHGLGTRADRPEGPSSRARVDDALIDAELDRNVRAPSSSGRWCGEALSTDPGEVQIRDRHAEDVTAFAVFPEGEVQRRRDRASEDDLPTVERTASVVDGRWTRHRYRSAVGAEVSAS